MSMNAFKRVFKLYLFIFSGLKHNVRSFTRTQIKKKRTWFQSDSDDDDTATGASSSYAPRVKVKIEPPKPMTYVRPCFKPKRPVRFANLMPLSDSDDEAAEMYASARRARLAATSSSRYSAPVRAASSSLRTPTDATTTRTSLDSVLDPGTRTSANPGTPVGSRTSSPSSSSNNSGERKRSPRHYCTHKRRTWSHLLDKKR